MLDLLRWNSLPDVITDAFSPFGKVLYRPLGVVYSLVMYDLFGLATAPFHVVAVILHIANSSLVVLVIRHITRNNTLAMGTGVLYAMATAVHVEPLLWLVGFYDVGSMFFFLVAFYLFLIHREALSAAAFLAAILIKESAVTVIGPIIFYTILFEPRGIRRIIPHGIVVLAFIVIKMLGVSPFSLGPDQGYRTQWLGGHILSNLSLYGQWALEAVFPFGGLLPRAAWGIVVLVFAVLVVRKLWTIRSVGLPNLNVPVFFALWAASGIVPVVLLTNQAFKYYIITSLAPFAALVIISLESVSPVGIRRIGRPLLILFAGAVAVWNSFSVQREFSSATDQVRIYNGTNHLITKAAFVSSVRSELAARFPQLPDSTIIIINGADLAPLGGSAAARLWYNNRTLDVMSQQGYDSLVTKGEVSLSRDVIDLGFPLDSVAPLDSL